MIFGENRLRSARLHAQAQPDRRKKIPGRISLE
jgi:hypothetical protein